MKKFIFFWLILIQFSESFSQESIFTIARSGSVDQVKELLKTEPNCINQKNSDGFTPLILACYRSNNEVAVFFIENGASINENSPMGTALMAAIVKGNNVIVSILLEKKADVNISDNQGITPLMYAVQFKNSEAIKWLLSKNADKTKVDSKGKTAFEYAVFSGNEEIINLLK